MIFTCSTVAPACKNCNPASAESIPPVAKIGKPGMARATADTARRAIGRIAFPETPPYVVFFSRPMPGQGDPSAFKPISPETVFVTVTPSAFPRHTKIFYTYRLIKITFIMFLMF